MSRKPPGWYGGSGSQCSLTRSRHLLPFGVDRRLAAPEPDGAVHLAVRVDGPGGDLDVQVRLPALLAVHVDGGDGLVPPFAPVVDEGLGALRPLLRRALRRKLDDLRGQQAVGGRAALDPGSRFEAVGGVDDLLLVAGGGLDVAGIVRVLALAADVGDALAGGLPAARFHAAEPGVECAHDLRQAVVSGHPPDAVILDACQQDRGLHLRLQSHRQRNPVSE